MPDTDEARVPEPAVLRSMFEIVTAISRTDEEFRKLLLSGRARSTYYSPKGQECISAGVGALLRRDDYIVTTYRGMHDHLAKGVPMRELFAEFLGRATGTCKSKGGPMHVTTHPAEDEGRAGRPDPEVPVKAHLGALPGRIDPPSWSQG
ncbi:thiamine pyrophosphate-dependent enzyme [Frankia sp. Cppng1_Ct_nod]|uniref:thiamine pyrophosphate-dependent enzyme n=1 Tax=Frankia sp. Cppng1_Ct_nod TaxID=2897162 RepID=UPI0020242E72|nr:thiamine pyrophosphate-dependent enzyme [Frankia sp. Cppng1_Ct_nod]